MTDVTDALKILVIPDTQVKPGVPMEHLSWAGQYIVDKRPDVVVHLGDHWDLPSLCMYDKGKKKDFESRRLIEDVQAGNHGLQLLTQPLLDLQAKQKNDHKARYKPRLVLLRGNHEYRMIRAIDANPRELDGWMGYHMFNDVELGWEVHDFLEPVIINDVAFSHYFYNPMSGNPYGGMCSTMLKNVGFSFVQGHKQGKDQAERHLSDGTVHRGLIVGCLTPEHRVLMADLSYRPIGELQPGDELISFDEYPNQDGVRSRRYRTGRLLRTGREVQDVYRVSLKSGKTFTVTEDHGWLRKTGSTYNWTTTAGLRRGTRLPRLLHEWEPATSFDAGWLSGMYDGEGSLYIRRTTGGSTTQLSITQKAGPILDRIKAVLKAECGVEAICEVVHDDVHNVRIIGGQREISKVLGILQPGRLIEKFVPEALGRICCPDELCDTVEAIIYAGKQEIVKTEVDCGTLIVEGYPHHNSFYQHDEEYKGPQANHHWRGLVMMHEVIHGNYDLMEVSLNYLRRRYGT